MAAKTAKKAKAVDPEDEELAGLDEELAALEAATDLNDLEEPDDELEEDEEETKPAAKRGKASKAQVESDEDDEEDDDEEDDEPVDTLPIADLDRSELKAYIKEQELDVTVKKSMSDDDIREAIVAAVQPDDDDEEDDEPEPPKKPRGRPRGSGSKPARVKEASDEPSFSADDVATIANLPEHQVRGFARKHPAAFPKASPKAQYRFNARQVRVLLKGLGVISS